jgi:hypothetical protein
MKASDIKTDGTEYAWQSSTYSSGRRIKVISKATVPGSWRRDPKPGWLVEFLDGTEGGYPKKGDRLAVTGRQIVSDWETFDRQAKAERESDAREQAERDARRAANESAVKELNRLYADHAITSDIPLTDYRQIITFTPVQLLALLAEFNIK